jgi:hypothetical protein
MDICQKNLGLSDAFIVKFYGDGTQLWTNQIGSISWDSAKAISIGSDGSIYIAGDVNSSLDGQAYLGSSDAFITKLSPNGTKLWTKQIGTSNADKATGIASGSDGSIYITGYTEGSIDGVTNAGFSDAFLMKISSGGTQLWKAQDAKNENKGFGVQVANTWYWYDNWIKEVEKYCVEHKTELTK